MSYAPVEYFSPLGLRMGWGVYQGSSSTLYDCVEPSPVEDRHEASLAARDRSEHCTHEPREAIAYSHYGYGSWWPVMICGRCLTVVEGLSDDVYDPNDDPPKVRGSRPGHPFADQGNIRRVLNFVHDRGLVRPVVYLEPAAASAVWQTERLTLPVSLTMSLVIEPVYIQKPGVSGAYGLSVRLTAGDHPTARLLAGLETDADG